MATPPFAVAQTTPGDNDIVSQFPAAERTFRDNINDWITVGHTTSGHHNNLIVATEAGSPAAVASHGVLFNQTGNWFTIDAVKYPSYSMVSVPPGAIFAFGHVPTATWGYLECNGQSVLRATYPNLFSAIGTTFGAADGTHFTMPDIRGRVIAGFDSGGAAARLTTAGGNVDSATVGAVGGAQNITLVTAHLPSHLHAVSITSGIESANHTHGVVGTSADVSQGHTHGVNGTSDNQSQNHTHPFSWSGNTSGASTDMNHQHNADGRPHDVFLAGAGGTGVWLATRENFDTDFRNLSHDHSYSGSSNTSDNNVNHTHGVNFTSGSQSQGHTHAVNFTSGGNSVNHTHLVSGNTGNTGSDAAHFNTQPTIILRYYIKT